MLKITLMFVSGKKPIVDYSTPLSEKCKIKSKVASKQMEAETETEARYKGELLVLGECFGQQSNCVSRLRTAS